MHFYGLLLFLLFLSGCQSGNDGGGGNNASDIITAPQALPSRPPAAASLNDIVNGVILTRLDVVLDAQSTVNQIDAALKAIDGRIITSQPGSLFVTVEVSRQADAAALANLATVLSGFPGITTAIAGREASTRLLPAFADAVPAIDEIRIDHLTLAKFPAAWNAGQRLKNCALNPVSLIIIDKFGALNGFGNELLATINREFPDYTLTGTILDNGETHGWEVAAMAAAAFDPSAYTGAMPFSGCLDLTLFSVAGLTYGEQIDAIEIALRLLGPTAVVNYSLGFRDRCDASCTATSITDGSSLNDFMQITSSYDRAWYALSWKYNTRDMWDKFIVVTASGDEAQQETSSLYTGLGLAPYNSTINYATSTNIIGEAKGLAWGDVNTPGFEYMGTDDAMFALLIDVDLALNLDNRAAKNVIMVASADANGASSTSDLGENLHANGIDRLSLSGTNRISGSSLAAPQVAGLVAYLWALEPELRTRPMADTIRAITENVQTTTPQPTLDAYATVLSLDKNTSSEPPDAPIREAILDVNDDGVFNQDDLTIFANLFQLETAPSPSTELTDWSGYSRVDLNGSGFIDLISGPERFDLDPENSTYLGAAVYGTVTFNIGAQSITLDESRLTDAQILCYYAYSPLYLGDELTRSNLLPAGVCGGSSNINFIEGIWSTVITASSSCHGVAAFCPVGSSSQDNKFIEPGRFTPTTEYVPLVESISSSASGIGGSGNSSAVVSIKLTPQPSAINSAGKLNLQFSAQLTSDGMATTKNGSFDTNIDGSGSASAALDSTIKFEITDATASYTADWVMSAAGNARRPASAKIALYGSSGLIFFRTGFFGVDNDVNSFSLSGELPVDSYQLFVNCNINASGSSLRTNYSESETASCELNFNVQR